MGERERQEYRRSRILGALGSRRQRRTPVDGFAAEYRQAGGTERHDPAQAAQPVEVEAAEISRSVSETEEEWGRGTTNVGDHPEDLGAAQLDEEPALAEYSDQAQVAEYGDDAELIEPADPDEAETWGEPAAPLETTAEIQTEPQAPASPTKRGKKTREKKARRKRTGRAVSRQRDHGGTPRGQGAATSLEHGARALGDDVVSAAFAERLARREAGQRQARRKRLFSALGILVVAGAFVWLLFFSPLLALDGEQVTVENPSEYVDTNQVHEIAAREAPTPLPRLSTGALQREIGALPGVLSVEVKRDWPRGLHITVTPREPMAAAVKGEEYILIDDQGTAIAQVQELPPGIPTLGVPLASPENTEAYEKVTAALSVLGVLPSDLRAQVAETTATSSDAVTLRMTNGAIVRWGSTADAELKAAVLEILVAEEPGIEYDVSVPDRPTVR